MTTAAEPSTQDSCRRRLPDYIPLDAARETAHQTAPDVTVHRPGEPPTLTAYRILEAHTRAVAARTSATAGVRAFLARKILKDLAFIAVRHFGFPILTPAAIEWMSRIIGQQRALEVGAGSGQLSAELLRQNVNVTATDPHPPGDNRYGFSQALCPITKLNASAAVHRLKPHVLIWSWPEMEAYTHMALRHFLDSEDGRMLIYIGEAEDGCCATAEFHQLLNTRCTITGQHYLPQFPGQHDRCLLFSKKPRRSS